MNWIGVDWINGGEPRAWAMDGNTVTAEAALDPKADEPWEEALMRLLAPWLDSDTFTVVAAGLAGATAAAALPCPPLPRPFAQSFAPDPRLRLFLIPGLRQDRPATDLTCGAETRIAGFVARHPQQDGILCLPGAGRSVWAHLSAGEVISLQSFLTPRLLPLLAAAGGTASDAFHDALEEGRSRPERIAARLAQIEAAGTLGLMPASEAQDRRAGLLLGAEIAAARPYWLGQPITVAGPAPLAALYVAALTAQGVPPAEMSEAGLTLAGLAAAHDRIAR